MPTRPDIPAGTAPPTRPLWLAAAVAGLALYWILFQQAPVEAGVRRGGLLAMVLRAVASGELLREWFSGPPQVALLERMVLLVPAALILLGAVALGWLILRAFRPRGLSRLELLVFAAAVGLSAVSTWVLLLGLAGGLRFRWLLAAPLVIAGVAAAWLWRRSARAPLPCPAPVHGWPGNGWLWLAAPLVAPLMAGALLPPTDFDVREYHLQAPKEFYEAGRIEFLPHNVYANMPLGTEMLSLLAMALVGDWWRGALVGKVLTASYALLGAMGLLAAGRRWFSPGAGVVAALVYLATPWILRVSTAGLVDAALAFYLFMAIYALLLWQTPAGLPSPALSGYLAGAAVAVKYPGMLFAVVPLAAAVTAFAYVRGANGSFSAAAGQTKGGQAAHGTKSLAIFTLAMLLGCGLWLGKNWAFTGNPTYPLLYSVFGGKTWTAEKDARWNRVHQPHDFSPGALATDMARLAGRSPWHSPVVVPLAVIALLTGWRASRDRRRTMYLLFGLMAYVLSAWWLLTHRIDRFWLPALPLAALLAGVGACWSTERLWRLAMGVLLGLAVVYGTLLTCSGVIGDNRYFHPLAELRRDPERTDPWHRFFNDKARPGRVLLIGEAQVFDFEVPVLYATCFDDIPLATLRAGRPPAEVHAELSGQRISRIYVDWAEIDRYRRPGNYGFSPIPQPALFDSLVASGVLEPLPNFPGHAGRGYRVRR